MRLNRYFPITLGMIRLGKNVIGAGDEAEFCKEYFHELAPVIEHDSYQWSIREDP